MKKINYTIGALKRKFGMGKGDFEPGALISKVTKPKRVVQVDPLVEKERIQLAGISKQMQERKKVAISGLV